MGKVTNKKRLERFLFLLLREWEILRRKPKYKSAFRTFQRQRRKDIVSGLKKFRNEYHISPIDPALPFTEILNQYLNNLKPGYRTPPFPIESLYFKGKGNFPIFTVKGFLNPKLAVVDINRSAFISDILSSIDSLLNSKGLKGTRAKSSNPPFQKAPQVLNDGSIQVYLNLECTKNGIINQVKNLLKREGFKEDVRKESSKAFLRQMAIYDYKKSCPKALFIEMGSKFRSLYPRGLTALQLEKCCNDDFNDAVRLIEPKKRKRKKEGAFVDHDRTIELMGTDSEEIKADILEIYIQDKKEAVQRIDRRKMFPSKVTPKLSQLWDREKQYEESPVKIFDAEEILKLNEKLRSVEKMIEIIKR